MMKLLLRPKLYLCIVFSLLWHITIGQRAMYVDDFDAILNSNVSKTQLLQYAQSHQITSLLLYDLHNVHNQHDLTNATTNQILADFIQNAKQNYGITKITAIITRKTKCEMKKNENEPDNQPLINVHK
jgi:hypothetical protein